MKKILLSALLLASPLALVAVDYSFSTTAFNDLSHGQAGIWGLSGSQYTSLLADVKATNSSIISATLTLKDPRDWQAERRDVLYVNILNGVNAGANKYTYNSNPSTTPNTTYGTNALYDSSGSKNDTLHSKVTFTDADPTKSLLRADNSSMPTNTTTGAQGFSTDDLAAMPGTWTDSVGPYDSTANLLQISDVAITFSAANLALFEQYLENDANATNPNVGLGFAAECHYYFSGIELKITTATRTNSVPEAGPTFAFFLVALGGLAALRRRIAA